MVHGKIIRCKITKISNLTNLKMAYILKTKVWGFVGVNEVKSDGHARQTNWLAGYYERDINTIRNIKP